MKKNIAIMAILMLFIIILIKPINVEAATDEMDFRWSTIDGKAQEYIKKGNEIGTNFEAGDLVNGIANILTTIGVVIVLAGLLIIGVKYMMATPDEAAKLKSQLVGLAISGIVIIGAFGIWNLTRNALDNITKDGGRVGVQSEDLVISPTQIPEPTIISSTATTVDSGSTSSPTQTIQQNSTQEEKAAGFIRHCYRNILKRTNDPIDDEITIWKNKVLNDKETAVELVYEILYSNESQAKNQNNDDIIETLYNTMLNRYSDAEGKEYWVNQLNSGMSLKTVINAFAETKEFMDFCSTYEIEGGKLK